MLAYCIFWLGSGLAWGLNIRIISMIMQTFIYIYLDIDIDIDLDVDADVDVDIDIDIDRYK